MTRSRSRTFVFVLVGLTLAGLVVGSLLEIGLRIAFAHSLDFSMEMWKYATTLKTPFPDPKISFVHIPGKSAFLMGYDFRINQSGQRDRDYPVAKPPSTYRIMLLGDSTTVGWGVAVEDTVAKILERKLNEARRPADPSFEVINTGIGNYTTVQEVAAYQRNGRAFKPDLVVLEYFINDAEPVPQEKKGLLLGRLYTAAFLSSRMDTALRFTGARLDWKKYYASLYEDDKPGWQAAKVALHDLVRTTREDGNKLLVTILPELRELNGDSYPFREAHRKLEAELALDAVPTMELIDCLKDQGPEETLWVTRADSHPNKKANTLIATAMLDRVLAQARGAPSTP